MQKVKEKAPTEFRKIKKTGKARPFGEIEEETLDELSSREIESVIKREKPQEQVETPIAQPILFDANVTIFPCSSENMDGELEDIWGKKYVIEDNSIHLVITSPPYNMNILYDKYDDNKEWDEYVTMLKRVFSQCYKKLVSGGRIAVNVANVSCLPGQKPHFLGLEVTRMLLECGFTEREFLTWVKAHEINVEGSLNALAVDTTAWGSWQSPSNPWLRSLSEFIVIMHKESNTLQGDAPDITAEDFMAWTRNVWFFPSASSKHHPAVFPVELPQRLIKLYSYPKQTVLDPFMGIGTTGLACVNRNFIGFDISREYCEWAMVSINENRIS